MDDNAPMGSSQQAGIESLGIAVPDAYVDLADLATARGVEPAKYIAGLGVTRMAIPSVREDAVTLAARAGERALASGAVDPSTIGLLIVGTETGVDHSKPVASFVQGLLGISRSARVFETKHACYGATAALQMALDWVRSGSARGKKALVIGADVARYGLGTPGEPTQGAGAVALVVSDSPAILAVDAGLYGVASEDVLDFWRPLYSKDAFVDGHYSVTCYLAALAGAFEDYRKSAGADASERRFTDRFDALVYHVPYGKMARKAHQHLRRCDGDDDPDASFDRLVAPSLVFPSLVGNCYAASLYLAFASLVAHADRDLAGRRVALFSYGSGYCAELFSGTVGADARARVRGLAFDETLASRRKLAIAEYEEIMRAREDQDRVARVDGGEGFRLLGVEQHKRVYAR